MQRNAGNRRGQVSLAEMDSPRLVSVKNRKRLEGALVLIKLKKNWQGKKPTGKRSDRSALGGREGKWSNRISGENYSRNEAVTDCDTVLQLRL